MSSDKLATHRKGGKSALKTCKTAQSQIEMQTRMVPFSVKPIDKDEEVH